MVNWILFVLRKCKGVNKPRSANCACVCPFMSLVKTRLNVSNVGLSSEKNMKVVSLWRRAYTVNTLDFTIPIGNTKTFLYFDSYCIIISNSMALREISDQMSLKPRESLWKSQGTRKKIMDSDPVNKDMSMIFTL